MRTAGPFDADSLPAGLRKNHRVAAGTWGCRRVIEGAVWIPIGTRRPFGAPRRGRDGAAEWQVAAGPLGRPGTVGSPMLKVVLPKGSLERATLELFEQADLTVRRSSEVDYRASVDDPRIAEVRILRPQEIPRYVAQGLFDLGVTGRDWIEETASDVITLAALKYSKATASPIRVVVAVAATGGIESIEDLPRPVRVSTEYPELARRYFERHGVEAEVSLSYGATEAKIPDIADAVVEITETGRALRAAGLRIIDTIITSYTELIANPTAYDDEAKGHAMRQLRTLLEGTLEARGRVLVKLNVSSEGFDRVVQLLPSLKSPTVSELFGEGGYAIETVVPKSQINILIPELKDAGATDIIELALSKIVH